MSVLTSPLKVRKGGCVPGARLCRSAGFLQRTYKNGFTQKLQVHFWCPNWCSRPLEIDSGHIEHYSFEPEDHEETLRERTVADAFTIAAGLQTQTRPEDSIFSRHMHMLLVSDYGNLTDIFSTALLTGHRQLDYVIKYYTDVVGAPHRRLRDWLNYVLRGNLSPFVCSPTGGNFGPHLQIFSYP